MHAAGAGFHWGHSGFWDGVKVANCEALLTWWVVRLNVLYCYAVDPSIFSTETGHFDALQQAGWLLTLERLLADALSIGPIPKPRR